MSPPDERRKHDKLPLEVRQYIELAAERGAEKAIVKLGAEIARAGLKKAVIAVGAAVVGLMSAVTYFITHGGGPPK